MITAEQTQAVETALNAYWAGGEPDQRPAVDWVSAYLELNCVSESNIDRLIENIYNSSFAEDQSVKEQTRRLALSLVADELNALGNQVAESSISDPNWLYTVLQRSGVLSGPVPTSGLPLELLASLLNQPSVGSSILPNQGQMTAQAKEVTSAVDGLRALLSAAQKAWTASSPLTQADCEQLGLVTQGSGLSTAQLTRLNEVLQKRSGEFAQQQPTYGTLNTITSSVIALDNKLTGATNAIDLTITDFQSLGVQGVTSTNVGFINQQLNRADTSLDTQTMIQRLVDQQLSDALARIQTAIDNQQTLQLTLQNFADLDMKLPEAFNLGQFKALLATHTKLSNQDTEQTFASIQQLNNLAQVSQKIAQFKDANPGNDTALTADDYETLSSVAELGWVANDVQARSLFEDVLRTSYQRGAVASMPGEVEQIASTVSDIHRVAAGARVREPLTLERLQQIGVLTDASTVSGDAFLKGLLSVIFRTESSGQGVDSLAELNAIAAAYQRVIKLVTDDNSTDLLEARAYQDLRIANINSNPKAHLLTDVLRGKTLDEVDTVIELQAIADVVHKVLAYAGAAPMALTQGDLEYLGITGLNEGRTAHLLAQLRTTWSQGEVIDRLDKIQSMVDTTAPDVQINNLRLSDDTGLNQTDFLTNRSEQTISAALSRRLEGGERLLGSVDGGQTWQDITDSVSDRDVRWNTQLLTSAALSDPGTNRIVFKVQDAAGNTGPSSEAIAYTLDLTRPDLPSSATWSIRFSDDTGTSDNDRITKDGRVQVVLNLDREWDVGPGETLQVSADGGKTWIDMTRSGTTWSTLDNAVTLQKGTGTFGARIIDIAGNVSPLELENNQYTSYTPVTPAPAGTHTVSLGDDTGDSSTDRITSDSQVKVTLKLGSSLTLAADEVLQVSADGGLTWVKLTGSGNTWFTADNAVTLQNGKGTIMARIFHTLGDSNALALTQNDYALDSMITSAPADTHTVSLSDDTGTSSTDRITRDNQVKVSLNLGRSLNLAVDESLQVSADGGLTWIDMKGSGTTWSTLDNAVTLQKGTGTFSARIIDIAGNVSVLSLTESNYTLDQALTPHAVVRAAVNISNDTGSSSTDRITSDEQVRVTFTLSSPLELGNDETIQVSADGGSTWVDMKGSGTTWSTLDNAVTLQKGTGTFSARIIDTAGNSGLVELGNSSYTLDTQTPVISNIQFSSDSGSSQKDRVTKHDKQTISATLDNLEEGDRIEGSVDGGVTWFNLSNSIKSKQLSWEDVKLREGNNTLKFKVIDRAGNELLVDTDYTLDTQDAQLRTVNHIRLSDDTGISDSDLITKVKTQTITATLSGALDTADQLFGSVDGGLNWIEITGSVSGNQLNWKNVSMLEGKNSLLFKIEDGAGNPAPSMAGAADYTLDQQAPTGRIMDARFMNDTGATTGGLSDDRITQRSDSQAITLTRNKEFGSDEPTYLFGSVDGGKNWVSLKDGNEWSPVILDDGTNKLSFKVMDVAGNETQANEFSYSQFNSAPILTGIRLSHDTGSSSTDFITRWPSQTVYATLSAPLTGLGARLSASVNGAFFDITRKVYGTDVVWDGVQLKQGTNRLSFTVRDSAGNSTTYDDLTYTLDTVAPTQRVVDTSLRLSNDDGSNTSDRITTRADQTITATLQGALGSGDSLWGSLDSGRTWRDITRQLSGTTLSWNNISLHAGSNALRFKVLDQAGNSGAETSVNYTLNTNAPIVTGVQLSEDTGISSNDRLTNVATQTITATLSAPLGSQKLYASLNANATNPTWVDISSSVSSSVSNTRLNWSGVTLLPPSGSTDNTLQFKWGTTDSTAPIIGVAEYRLDQTAPTTRVDRLTFSEDTAGLAGNAQDRITKTPIQQLITLSLSDKLDSTDRLYGSVDNGTRWTELTHLINDKTVSWKEVVLLEGSNQMRFRVEDAAGNVKDAGSHSYALYSVMPSISNLNFSSDTGFSGTDLITNTPQTTIRATLSRPLQPGARLYADLGNGVIDITDKVQGTSLVWSNAQLTNKAGEDAHSVKLTLKDTAGNDTTIHQQRYTLDTSEPTQKVSNVTLSADTGAFSSDRITNTPVQTLTGKLDRSLDWGSQLLGSVDNGQNWVDITRYVNGLDLKWVNATLVNGSNTLLFRVVDKAGNQSATSGSSAYVLDTSVPTQTVTVISLSADTGFSNSDRITKTASQNIQATLSAKLGTNEKLWGSVDGGANWTDITAQVKDTTVAWKGATLLSGTHAIRFKVTNLAGNELAGNETPYSLITTPPTISNVKLSTDTGLNANDLITNAPNQTVYASLSRDILPNEALYGSLNGGKDWVNVTQAVKGNTVQWAVAALAEGSNSIVFKIEDAAGNTGTTNSTVCTLDTQAPVAPTLTVHNNGEVTVLAAPAHTNEAVLSYRIDFTDETGAQRTLRTEKLNGVWSATDLPQGATVHPITGTVQLDKNLILDGSNVVVTVFDLAGNSNTVLKVASADIEPRPGDRRIDLGTFGTLIAPVQVEGKWYYHWDINGDGVAGYDDARSMDWLAENFFGSKDASLITDSNRTFAVNGVSVRLPTVGGAYYNANTPGTAYSKPNGDPNFNSNLKYDDLTAIWDAFNGSFEGLPYGSQEGTIVKAPGIPVGWLGQYWSSTWHPIPLADNNYHYLFNQYTGSTARIVNRATSYGFALEVLETVNTTKTIDPKTVRLSNDSGSSSTDRITQVAEQTITASLNTNLGVADVLEASTDSGKNWSRLTSTHIQGTTIIWDKVILVEGANTILFKVTDAAGNNILSPGIHYKLDKTAPGVNSVAFSQDTGDNTSDRKTTVAAQSIALQLTEVLDTGSKILGSVDGGVTWSDISFNTTGTSVSWQTQLHGGSNNILFKGQDAAGNTFTRATFAYTLETSMPIASDVKLSADISIADNLITKTAAQTITATLSAALTDGQQLFGSLDSGKTWTNITSNVNKQAISWNTSLISGANAIQFKVTEATGEAVLSGSTAYVLDADKPTLNLNDIKFSRDTGAADLPGSGQDLNTNTAAQTITATLSKALATDERLYASLDGGLNWVDITGKVKGKALSWDNATLLAGNNTLQFKLTDTAQNDSDIVSAAYKLDTVVPTQTVSNVALRFDTGLSSTDLVTTIAKQTITARLSAALDADDLLYGSIDNGTTWVDITRQVAEQDIEWSEPELPEGKGSIVFKVTDKAGNVSATNGLTGLTPYTVDSTAPTQMVNNVKLSKDTGANTSDFITTAAAQTISATLNAELTTNEKLFARVDKTSTWTDITSSIIDKTTILWTTTLKPGTNELEFKVINGAGNEKITGQTPYTLNLIPTLNVNDNGSLAVFTPDQPGNTYAYALSYTDENRVAQTITVSKNASGWSTTGLPQTGVAVLQDTGSLRVDKDQILDGSKVTIKMVDSLGSTDVSSATVGNDTTSLKGNPIIDLGTQGKLIAPVQVKGSWYYYWDTNGNGQADAADAKSMNWLESTFFGGGSTGSVVTDSNRTFKVNNVELQLPTLSSNTLKLSGTSYSSPIDDKTASSGTVNLQTVWDAFNGTATTTDLAGTPPDWFKGNANNGVSYASASSLKEDVHQYLILESGWTNLSKADDSISRFFALEVL